MDNYESKESLRVLDEAAALQRRKSQDYQNPLSRIRQADHYPRGCATIIDMVHQKITRIYSVMEAMESGKDANFESLEDSAIDAINYLSFFVSYARKKMDGQNTLNDIFNRPTCPIDGSSLSKLTVNDKKIIDGVGILNNSYVTRGDLE